MFPTGFDTSNSSIPENLPQQQNISRSFQGMWIPAEVWLREDLSIHEKCLWAEIQSLHCPKHGGCYASNEYLMKFMGLQERRLREILSSLRDKGWIEVVSWDGRRRVMKAIPPHLVKPVSSAPVSPAEKCRADQQDPATPSYIENKEENKQQQPAAAAVVFSCLKDLEIPEAVKIRLTESNINNEQDVINAVAYATHPETKINKTLAQAITWAIKEKPQVPINKRNMEEENREYALSLEGKIRSDTANYVAGSTYAEINSADASVPICISYTEHGFKEQLNNALRKRKFKFI